jgi:nucleotide-binding universal stress UspA family protein
VRAEPPEAPFDCCTRAIAEYDLSSRKENAMPVWRKILCAIDFSPPSRDALLKASELAASSQAELLLLHVQEIPAVRAGLGMMPPPPKAPYELALGEALKELEHSGADAAVIAKARVPVQMAQGSAPDEIVRVARERQVNVIVLGTHGRTGVKRAVLGSVAELVVRRAPCSVVVVRPEAAAMD